MSCRVSMYRTPVYHNAFGCWTWGQPTVLTFRTPPGYTSVRHGQWEVQKDSHESQPSVQCGRENIIVPLPPTLSVSEDEEIEYCSNKDPCVEIQGCSWWHCTRCTEKYWEVNEWNPFLCGECFMQQPNQHWSQCANEKEPVEGWVVSQIPKYSSGPYQTPDDRCIIEDSIAWACPRTIRRK